jgi:hypothetical protein
MATSRIKHLTNAVLLASLVFGIAAVPFNLRLALLPAAFVFGWSQIGGL